MPDQPLKLHAPWEQVRELLMEADTSLTEADLAYEPGQEETLLQRLEKKLGKNKEQLRSWIESVSYNTGMAG